MNLELIKEAAQGPSRPVKLLFIHGICTAAWLWRPLFLPYFAGLGYESYALSLRGHGESEGREDIRKFSLADFAEDIGWALDEIGGPVVVVGHSLGGGALQSFIRRGGKVGRRRAPVLRAASRPHPRLRRPDGDQSQAFGGNAEGSRPGPFRRQPRHHRGRAFLQPAAARASAPFSALISDIAETASRQLIGWLPFAPLPWGMPKLLVIGGDKDQFVPADGRSPHRHLLRHARCYRAERRACGHAGCELAGRREAHRGVARQEFHMRARLPLCRAGASRPRAAFQK